jgi:hypothetical protein
MTIKYIFLQKLFILFTFGAILQVVHGQEISHYNPIFFPSPNASSLGEFGKIPVSLFTGTADISIPLYNITQGTLNVPVSIRYHGSGIRVDEQPSCVGLGWSIQAGGAITRVVNGLPDEANIDYLQPGGSTKFNNGIGYLYTHSLLADNNWYDYSNDSIYPTATYDKEPDEFNFNFNGINGSFYLDHNGNWVVKSDLAIKVLFDSAQDCRKYFTYLNNKMFYRFKLMTPDGTTYVFGGDMAAIEFTWPQSNIVLNSMKTATSWNLTKIIDSDGNEINFKYIRGNLIPQMSFAETFISANGRDGYWWWLFGWHFWGQSCTDNRIYAKYTCMLMEPSYLESIKTKNQTVMFYSNTANDLQVKDSLLYVDTKAIKFSNIDLNNKFPKNYNIYPYAYDSTAISPNPQFNFGFDTAFKKRKKLTDIVVYPNDKSLKIPDNTNTGSRVYDFSNSFKIINFHYDEQHGKRIMLKGITLSSPDGLQTENYTFNYNDFSYIKLPGYASGQTDHWGYYNGKHSDTIPNYYQTREPATDINYLLEGTLSKITYPTGGYTEFEYEAHNYSSWFNRIPFGITQNSPYGVYLVNICDTNKVIPCSGLRIKRIKSYSSATSNPIVHTYYYQKNFSTDSAISSGYLYRKPIYWMDATLGCNNTRHVFTGGLSLFNINSLMPLSVDGSHIGYSDVIDEELGKGYTHYKFTMPKKIDPKNPKNEDYQDRPPVSFVGNSYLKPLNELSLERGKVLLKEVFDNNKVLVSSVQYKYSNDTNRFTNCVRSRNLESISTCGGSSLPLGTARYIYTYPFFVTEEKETNYVNGIPSQVVTKDYTYNNTKLIKKIDQTQSDGSLLTTEYKYPADYSSPYSYYTPIKLLIDKNIVNAEVEKISSITRGTNKYIIGVEFKKYGLFYNIVKPQTIYSLNSATPILFGNYNSWDLSSINSGSISLHTTYNNNVSPQSTSLVLNTNSCIIFNTSTVDYNFSDVHGVMSLKIDTLPTFQSTTGITSGSISIPQFSFTVPRNYSFKLSCTGSDQGYGGGWYCGYTTYSLNNDISVNSLLHPDATLNYDNIGNVIEFQKTNNLKTSYLWGYNKTLPVVKVEGKAYADIPQALKDAVTGYTFSYNTDYNSINKDMNWLKTQLSTLLVDKSCFVTFYTYSPLLGITSMTDPSGVTIYYEYDSFGRLHNIKDDDGHILKSYEYNYDINYNPINHDGIPYQ